MIGNALFTTEHYGNQNIDIEYEAVFMKHQDLFAYLQNGLATGQQSLCSRSEPLTFTGRIFCDSLNIIIISLVSTYD